jgi:anti-sigma factor (TIGR02949 family)
MACNLTTTALHGYMDGELDAERAAEFERHLERCPECLAAFQAQEALRASLHRQQLYEKAPESFQKKLFALTVPARSSASSSPARFLWLRIATTAAAVLLLAYACWRAVPWFANSGSENALAAEIVDAHLRALQPGHLTDVTSSDQHTVKPWFDGRIDFAPPVRDFGDQGFPLQGGRLDIVDGRTVAALVYGRRKHLVSVFVWPINQTSEAVRSGSRQGYQWLQWDDAGMRFWVVADTSVSDIQQFHELFVQRGNAGSTH